MRRESPAHSGDSTSLTYALSIARNELDRHFRERGRRQRQLSLDDVALVDPEPWSLERLAHAQRSAAFGATWIQLSADDRPLLQRFHAEDVCSNALARGHGIKLFALRLEGAHSNPHVRRPRNSALAKRWARATLA